MLLAIGAGRERAEAIAREAGGAIHVAMDNCPHQVVLAGEAGAIERAYDYVLPSGLHSDTHVRVGKLCHSEERLKEVAGALHRLFSDVERWQYKPKK